MRGEVAHNHHYAPRFYLRNFSDDGTHMPTVGKNGEYAVWLSRPIESLGSELDFYVHSQDRAPVSVESIINKDVENPISSSEAWRKISAGNSKDLDRSDKFIIYALIRHLEVRTPHYLQTLKELAELASIAQEVVEFEEEEKQYFKYLHSHPEALLREAQIMSASLRWTRDQFDRAALSILRSSTELRSSSTPVQTIAAPADPRLYLPLVGMKPYQLKLTLDRFTLATLVLGDFDGAFVNMEISEDIVGGFNRHSVAQFSHFPQVKHLITQRAGLDRDMLWAPYDKISEDHRKVVYRRR